MTDDSIDIGALHSSLTAVGSRVTCDPAPESTDRDWLVLVNPEKYGAFVGSLLEQGWDFGGSYIPRHCSTTPADERFVSLRRGVDNIILTESPEFHRRFLAASFVARRLNLLGKDDRIALFQAVLYGNQCATGETA